MCFSQTQHFKRLKLRTHLLRSMPSFAGGSPLSCPPVTRISIGNATGIINARCLQPVPVSMSGLAPCDCDCRIGSDDLFRRTSPPGLNATKSRERFHPRTVSSPSLLRRSSVLGRTQLLSPSFSNARQRKHFARTRECSRVRCQREGFTCLIGGTLRSGAVGPAFPSGHYVKAPAAALFPPFA